MDLGFLNYTFFGNSLIDYLLFFSTMVVGAVVSKIVDHLVKKGAIEFAKKTKNKLDDIVVFSLEKPIVILTFTFFVWLAFSYLSLPTVFIAIESALIGILVSAAFIMFATKLIDGLVDVYLKPLTERTESKLDDQLLPIIKKISKISVVVLVFIIFLDNQGFDVGTLLAGLGIGGLAVAMASKDTIENLISGFLIIFDKPFTIGDFVNINGIEGQIEEVGIRSTRIRTYAGTLVTIPNSKVSTNSIENISKRPARKEELMLTLTYDTSPKKMEKAKQILKQIFESIPEIRKDYLIIFKQFSDSSLDLYCKFWIEADYVRYMHVKDEVNTQVLEKFNKAKIDFAYPTQTIYLKK